MKKIGLVGGTGPESTLMYYVKVTGPEEVVAEMRKQAKEFLGNQG